jgi:hypothetical protein
VTFISLLPSNHFFLKEIYGTCLLSAIADKRKKQLQKAVEGP